MALIDDCRLALEISTLSFDNEISRLIEAGFKDLNIGGADSSQVTSSSADSIVKQAVIAYVCYQFSLIHGNTKRSEYLKKAYDEMKAQLGMATGYTTGGDFDADQES